MSLISILGGLVAILGAIIAFILPSLKRKNKQLELDLSQKEAEIELVQENEKIERNVGALSAGELIKLLRKSKT